MQAVSNLNKVYLQHHQIEKNNLKIASADKLNINLVKFNEMLGGHKNLATYEALMYALDPHTIYLLMIVGFITTNNKRIFTNLLRRKIENS